ncbi:hypothetical protein ACFQO1_12595 [Jejudonia soesokkakensis]|uniref:Gram-positive cocci surface proteins LPxTG domain-containing protein n=1 Tax=Jejudonia soesokkakensis TaxID=1323432 RepID=A0ABW2MYA2_9FLAO
MDKTTKALIKADSITYLIFSILLIGGGIYSLLATPVSPGNNINTFYQAVGVFMLLIGVGVFVALLIKHKK